MRPLASPNVGGFFITSKHHTLFVCTMLDVKEAAIQTRSLSLFSSSVLGGQEPCTGQDTGFDLSILKLRWLERLRWEAYKELHRRISSPPEPSDVESESDFLEDRAYNCSRLESFDDWKFATHIAFVLRAITATQKYEHEVSRHYMYQKFDSLQLSYCRSIRKMPF